jgi:small subunit ribosomal protein S9|tara:strand:+ start:14492 stop:14968 length:477 start_codon:yes stop_codon:yes gene_type:complete
MDIDNLKSLNSSYIRYDRLPPPFPIAIGVGRRKTATAIVTLFFKDQLPDFIDSKFNFVINNNPFPATVVQFNAEYLNSLYLPLRATGTQDLLFVNAIVKGSGISSRVDAIKLALSRALSSQYRRELKMLGLLTIDTRQKERKKYGLKKARKASQYAKR